MEISSFRSLYLLRILLDYNINLTQPKMGKTLRSRKILDETDEQIDLPQNNMEINHINQSQLRKIISHRIFKRNPQGKKKIKFIQRVINRSFSQAINEAQLECPICLELLINPMMRKCGHIYCYRCLQSTTAHNKRCCVCRQDQGDESFIHSRLAQTLINDFILPKSKEIYNYLCRSTDSSEWAKRRKITNIIVGLVVDFNDCFNAWRRGIILKVFPNSKDKMMAQIKINIKGEDFTETVEVSSNRLAPYTFFTRRRYLQEFSPPVLSELQLKENQLSLLEYKQRDDEDEFFRYEANNAISEDSPQNLDYFEAENIQHSVLDQALNLLNYESFLTLN